MVACADDHMRQMRFYGFRPSDNLEFLMEQTATANASLYAVPIYRKAWLLQKEMQCFEALNKGAMAVSTLSKYESAKLELMEAEKYSFRDPSDAWLFNSSLEFLGRVLSIVYRDEALFPFSARSGTWRLLVSVELDDEMCEG